MINRETTLKEVLEDEELIEVLKEYDVPCLTCPMAKIEMGKLELGKICDNYNIDGEKLIKALNEKKK